MNSLDSSFVHQLYEMIQVTKEFLFVLFFCNLIDTTRWTLFQQRGVGALHFHGVALRFIVPHSIIGSLLLTYFDKMKVKYRLKKILYAMWARH